MGVTTKAGSGTPGVVPATLNDDALARARKVMAEAPGIDSHIDTIQRVLVMGEDLGQRHDAGHVDFPRLREGGMRAPFFAFWVPVFFHGAEAVRRTLDLRDAMQSVLETHKDEIELATTAAEIQRTVRAGKISAFLTIEGGHTIDDDLHVLRMYVSKMPALVAVLLKRGYSESDLKKILGENTLRVVREVTGA